MLDLPPAGSELVADVFERICHQDQTMAAAKELGAIRPVEEIVDQEVALDIGTFGRDEEVDVLSDRHLDGDGRRWRHRGRNRDSRAAPRLLLRPQVRW